MCRPIVTNTVASCANHRAPIFCIVPPHILEHIIKRGNAEHVRWALRTLTLSSRFVGRREVLGTLPGLMSAGTKRRTVYDASNQQGLPGVLVRGEGDPPTGDVGVNEAYDGAGATYDFYHQVFNRNSVDDHGLRLDSTVHYGQQYDNAFWNGSQMVYGDGDGQIFNRFTISIDVIGHELTHGVTQYTAALEYHDQPGALNESFSDVFGSMIKQLNRNEDANTADWLIGQGLLKPAIKGRALRDMCNPGTAYDDPLIGPDPQPADMAHYVQTQDDNGGVHINSGIPNRAFCLAAKAAGGNSWQTVGPVWYEVLTKRLSPTASFADAATATVEVAAAMGGTGSTLHMAVQNAWITVGVLKGNGGPGIAPTPKPKQRAKRKRPTIPRKG